MILRNPEGDEVTLSFYSFSLNIGTNEEERKITGEVVQKIVGPDVKVIVEFYKPQEFSLS